MRFHIVLAALFARVSLCYPPSKYGSGAPTAKVKNGTYQGYYAPAYDTDNFLGIPYAKPPTENRRFRVPQSLDSSWEGIRDATKYGPLCYGYGFDTVSQVGQGSTVSDDCLTINVVRPANAKGKLPVGFWMHGGGLVMGGSADNRYNLSFIVEESAKAGSPIIGVSINYRLSAWGFLYGKEVQKSGQTNLGFRDQRLALHWVQENIEAFGGDPSKVTIWGESSGANSVGAQLLAYDGRDDKIFSGAIAESGAPARVNPYPTPQSWEPVYQSLAEAVGCKGASDTLQCLRIVSAEDLNNAINSSATTGASYGPVIDGDFVQKAASVQLQKGEFVKVPYIIVQNADEGTMFGPHGVNTTEEFLAYLKAQAFDDETSQTLSYLYPDIPAIGIPGTWKGRANASATYGVQYKRSSSVGGDLSQHAPRRLTTLSWAAQKVPVYSGYFDVLVNGQPYTAGATHFQEVAFVFYNTMGYGYPQNLRPNPLGGILRPRYLALAKIMTRMWIGFISTGNPNSALDGVEAEHWPAYTLEEPMNYMFDANMTSHPFVDTYRAEAINYLIDIIIAREGRNCTGLAACKAPYGVKYGNTDGPPPLLHY
ncbi:alpha/beta-hydrolase [Rhizodiscina lignyota]|uniref:Carboxylic ester hydrolase n=1 Tax=Rhizodiscina lignyota TaxID=1504668 RepID=A0A9P4M6I2_9PEZI|nr:alpha/beta-hydrolase [Rhizodiscina lignyota]